MPRTLADLAEALRASDTLTADHAVKIWAGMGELAKVLRKAGHPKPKRTGKVAPPRLARPAGRIRRACPRRFTHTIERRMMAGTVLTP